MIQNNFLITSRPTLKRDKLDEHYLAQALKIGFLAGSGVMINKYEQALTDFYKVKNAVVFSSGTGAIHSSLFALGVKPGDEVIMPATAPVMTAMPIIALGARPVFVDIQKNNFGISIESLKKKITKRTKCIISVAMWGYPTNKIKELTAWTKARRLPLLEDASQAIGTLNHGHFEGTFGAIGCFSTHELKLISTGEGGFLVTDKKEYATQTRSFARFGMIVDESQNKPLGKYGYANGLNYKCNSLIAALGLSQLKKLTKRLSDRRKVADLYTKKLKSLSNFIEPFYYPNKLSVPNYYGYILLIKNSVKISAKEVASALLENKIYTDFSAYDYQPLYKMPIFKKYVQGIKTENDFKNTEHLMTKIIILPAHEGMTERHVNYICQVLANIFLKQQI